MEIFPVLDVLDGNVVHAIAGRRDEYRPIVSRLTSSHEPLAVANAIRAEYGLSQFYLADLDGILKQQPNLDLYQQLIANGFQLLIDPGIRNSAEGNLIQERTSADLVVALESCRSPTDLAMMTTDAAKITFSLDLFHQVPRRHRDSSGWAVQSEQIVRQAMKCHVTSIIVLDLADVGMGTGGSTDSLCSLIHAEFPQVRLIAGGGVRGHGDLQRLRGLGVDAVLVASGLHDGRLSRDDISVES